MNFPRHFSTEFNKLEMSPLITGGGVSVINMIVHILYHFGLGLGPEIFRTRT
jgi:hypothetical protein